MNFGSSSSDSLPYDAIRPSSSLAPQQVEQGNHEALILQDVPFDFLDVEGSAVDPFFLSLQVPPPSSLRNVKPFVYSHVIGEPQRIGRSSPHVFQQPTSSGSFPQQPVIHPTVAAQSPFDGTYSLQTHPSAWNPAGPSSAWYGGGEQTAPAGGQNMAMPGTVPMAMTAPAAAPFSSMHVTVPTSGSPAGAHTPVVRSWDAAAATAAGASARAVPRPVPATYCRCHLRAHPFVRIDDRIEWVRPDLMRMSVWFNWSPNAEAEAHETWEPRRG